MRIIKKLPKALNLISNLYSHSKVHNKNQKLEMLIKLKVYSNKKQRILKALKNRRKWKQKLYRCNKNNFRMSIMSYKS